MWCVAEGEPDTDVVIEVLREGLITGLIGTDPVFGLPIKDSGRCVTDLSIKRRLGPPRDDSLLARHKN